jgi:hypothetical protein
LQLPHLLPLPKPWIPSGKKQPGSRSKCVRGEREKAERDRAVRCSSVVLVVVVNKQQGSKKGREGEGAVAVSYYFCFFSGPHSRLLMLPQ